MKVPFFELISQFKTIEGEVRSALDEVFATQQFIMGQKVEALEKTVAEYCRSRFGIGVASGSDALLLSLMALGIGPGDEVLLPPFTFFATAGAVSRLGAIPVFVDIDEKTYNIDPSRIEEKITPKTKAIIPVHLYGQCADMDPILDIAGKKGLSVIEDAAQALGAEYHPPGASSGRMAGNIGHFGCFSFFPTKNLGAFGDAGMVTTDHPEWAEKIRLLRLHGSHPKYYHKIVGINSRLDALQAAILLAKMRHLDSWTRERQRNATRYDTLFEIFLAPVWRYRFPIPSTGIATFFINTSSAHPEGMRSGNSWPGKELERRSATRSLSICRNAMLSWATGGVISPPPRRQPMKPLPCPSSLSWQRISRSMWSTASRLFQEIGPHGETHPRVGPEIITWIELQTNGRVRSQT